ncbi:MAG: hydrogenase expression/formation protein HypE [Bacteroidales bacterium]|nr:hydrogenase expression/formation protein HypE [Bacteroidales bacterium]
MAKEERIRLGHGSGGKLTHELIDNLFVKHFSNPELDRQTDAALLSLPRKHLAFTTDAFVVDPIFFPGGDIGKLAVCGTVNDVAVSGASPLYLSVAFIIEEGFPLDDLERIVRSMAMEAKNAGVSIVTGDTKVVNKGHCDKVFITTTGIGTLKEKHLHISEGKSIRPGDKIIVNGSIGDHGMAIMSARNELKLNAPLLSDCASLNGLISVITAASSGIRFMRDATRGGLATVITELCHEKDFGISINEDAILVSDGVRGMCELLGFDPMYVANEGKVVVVTAGEDAENVLDAMHAHDHGKDARIIGEIVTEHPGKAWLNTAIGGNRIIDMLAGEQLPRIC